MAGGVAGYLNRIQVSSNVHDGAAMETCDLAFKPAVSNQPIPSLDTGILDPLSEGGRTTSLPEGTPIPLFSGGSYSFPFNAYASALSFFTYWGANPGAAVNAVDDATTNQRSHTWEWPGVDTNPFISHSVEALGLIGTDDDNHNRDFHNVICTEFTLNGSRKNHLSGNLNLQFGGVSADGDTGTGSLSVLTERLFHFGNVRLYHNPTAGFAGASPAQDWTAQRALAGTDLVVAGALDLSAYLLDFKLTFRQPIDDAASYAPGNLGASDEGVVPYSTSWVPGAGYKQAELVMGFSSIATGVATYGPVIAGFARDKEAKTFRGFELWIEEATVTETGVYLGAKYTFGKCEIVSVVESAGPGDTKRIEVTVRPWYDSTAGNGAFISVSSLNQMHYGD